MLKSAVAQAFDCNSICVHSLCLHVWPCHAESSALQSEMHHLPHATHMHCELLNPKRSASVNRKHRCQEIAPCNVCCVLELQELMQVK